MYLLTKNKEKKEKSKKKNIEITESNLSSASSSELSDDCILLSESSLLIGSTTERLALREKIDRAYEKSAKTNQIKDANKQQEESACINMVNRRKKLREERAARVLLVPTIILHPTTVIQVRHISVGLISRISRMIQQCKMYTIGLVVCKKNSNFFHFMSMVEMKNRTLYGR